MRNIDDALESAADELTSAQAEIDQLRRWKSEAIEVLAAWEKVWEAAGKPGAIGGSKAESTAAEVERLHRIIDDQVKAINALWEDAKGQR